MEVDGEAQPFRLFSKRGKSKPTAWRSTASLRLAFSSKCRRDGSRDTNARSRCVVDEEERLSDLSLIQPKTSGKKSGQLISDFYGCLVLQACVFRLSGCSSTAIGSRKLISTAIAIETWAGYFRLF